MPACQRQPSVAHAASHEPQSKIVTVRKARLHRRVRATGVVQAVRAFNVMVPRIAGQGGNLTLTALIPNGSTVKTGDLLARFDRTQEMEAAREANAKYQDLEHQVEQKQAEHRSEGEKRRAALQQAEADLAKAKLEIRKGPIISEIDQLKNQAKLEDARVHVASLKKSNGFRDEAESSAIRILELQRDRQKVSLERSQHNSELLEVRAPLAGMVALDNVWRNGTMGHAQEGDQLWPGSPLLRIFDPSEMELMVSVGEPDEAVLSASSLAQVQLDAYPDLRFTAHFESSSPVATSALGSSIRSFSARFKLDQSDPHLLPDLSAAIDIQAPDGPEVLTLPRNAVRVHEDKVTVLRVTPKGPVEQAVELAGFDATNVEIASGLAADDQVLLQGAE
ncbi:MAG TPA: efflux RND transporter periplasmic adaptor subunit [Bryobacteraceae bacterium]|nr:efflux RND transporter periplasmic adaptor subunit [Bryobacteraceae bacterium]